MGEIHHRYLLPQFHPNRADFMRGFMRELENACGTQLWKSLAQEQVALVEEVIGEVYEDGMGGGVCEYLHKGADYAPYAAKHYQQQPVYFSSVMVPSMVAYLRHVAGLPRPGAGLFSAPVVNFLNLKKVLSDVLEPIYSQGLSMYQTVPVPTINARNIDLPKDSKKQLGTSDEILETYLGGTAFVKLFEGWCSVEIPEDIRFQHQWVIAPTGSGKTQLLQLQIARDLSAKCATIVMDSQGLEEGRLLFNIERLKQFAPGGTRAGKLVVLQPNPDTPLSLNLFDMGQNDPALSGRERQMMYASALKMISFCLGGTTEQQQDMIEYLVQLGLEIEGATIDTVRRMLQLPKADFQKEYGPTLEKADEVVRDYFLHSFHAQSMSVTREAVMRRIMGMLKNPTFRKMFQAKTNSFDMKKEIDAGKVILINTDVALLGEAACELFGRYFISLLLLATQQRRSDMPVHVYIDECQDYIANDENVATLLDKARKQHVAFTFAHQRLANIKSPNVVDALSNCAIKFAGGNITDAPILAKYMRTTPEFIADQKPLSFAAFIRGETQTAVSVQIEYGVMEGMERTTSAEHQAIWDDIDARYYSRPVEPMAAARATEQHAPPAPGGAWDDVV